jgi:hypothetical protein
MPVFVTNCPHCGAKQMNFAYRGDYVSPKNVAYALANCSGCFSPIVVQVEMPSTRSFNTYPLKNELGNVMVSERHSVRNIWPEPEQVDVPAAVPERVARNFIEAAESRKARHWNAACASYRRCMEIALKQFAPDVDAWKLEKRIDKLAAENRITPDIQKWAHELRLDGNEALHGDEDATEEMVDQMHHLTYFLLTYLYTLPNQIEEVRARRETEAAAEQ